ncbi:MAG TPA: phosphopentomutase [Proteiniclasticum sp.]|uniref:phosphopentomutase n=1 Tax=Proteiniclasticum sp. TaxID=2053595 RepID=UPI000E8E5910|nr:phosphopentomutase [Proteiniclasticum sp.]HBW13437.1 phosphopentomutase [Proteiniclasticum sp.]
MKRAILVVLDSVGIGEMPDADQYGDVGSNTLGNIADQVGGMEIPHLEKLGLGNIAPLKGVAVMDTPEGAFGKSAELSVGKDTVTGHWEMSGVILEKPLNTYPEGFSKEIMDAFESKIGRKTLGNVVASGTEIIERLGDEHVKTGFPIIYTSADSVFQIAAHEGVIPLDELYRYCEVAREMLVGDWQVGRVIARPFVGEDGVYTRTENRKDFALDPFNKTILEYVKEAGQNVMCVGKISDVFNNIGVTHSVHTKNNMQGVDETLKFMKEDLGGLLWTNLVDFDMKYGHRNDYVGYYNAIKEFDERLPEILETMTEDDILILTADHGCDPTTPSTDHSREYIPILVYGKNVKPGANLGVRRTFSDIGKTVLEYLGVQNDLYGESFWSDIKA